MSLADEYSENQVVIAKYSNAYLLNPELRLCLRPSEVGDMIHHPLMVTFYSDDPAIINQYNEGLRQVKEQYQQAVKEGEFYVALFIYTARPYRTDAFDVLAELMSDEDYWSILGELWRDQENPEDFPDEWRKRFDSKRGGRVRLMDDDDRAALAALPDPLIIYRGGEEASRDMLSWTTDLKVAKWFSTRFGKGYPIWQSTLAKEHVLAFWTGRGESGVLVLDPGKLGPIEPVRL